VLLEPALDRALDVGASVAELGELDEVLELEVVDVVDRGRASVTEPPVGEPRPRRR
jgi:hypothetical protein